MLLWSFWNVWAKSVIKVFLELSHTTAFPNRSIHLRKHNAQYWIFADIRYPDIFQLILPISDIPIFFSSFGRYPISRYFSAHFADIRYPDIFQLILPISDIPIFFSSFCRYPDIFQLILPDTRYRYISYCLETTPSLSCVEIISKLFLILVSF